MLLTRVRGSRGNIIMVIIEQRNAFVENKCIKLTWSNEFDYAIIHKLYCAKLNRH